jgi:hypothetical protein
MTNAKKVYCNNCKYLYDIYCEHPKTQLTEDTPLNHKTYSLFYHDINKNNDCPYWEEKVCILDLIFNFILKYIRSK